METSFIQVIEEVEQLNKQNHINQQAMTNLAGVNQEVSIGKRNINCLSCSPERTIEEMQSRYYKEESPKEKKKLQRPATSTNVVSRRILKPISLKQDSARAQNEVRVSSKLSTGKQSVRHIRHRSNIDNPLENYLGHDSSIEDGFERSGVTHNPSPRFNLLANSNASFIQSAHNIGVPFPSGTYVYEGGGVELQKIKEIALAKRIGKPIDENDKKAGNQVRGSNSKKTLICGGQGIRGKVIASLKSNHGKTRPESALA